MGVSSTLQPAADVGASGFAKIMSYAWILFPVVFILFCIGVYWVWRIYNKKGSQWTHKLKVRRVLHGGQFHDNVSGKTIHQKLRLSEPFYMNMRRFPLIKKAEVFELEKPLLGGYLLPELDQYSGENEFSIILDTNNRIYTNQGEFWDPDKNCVNVSAKHSEIDIQRANLKADFQNINIINKRVEWATIAKYAFMTIFVVAIMIVSLTALSKWGAAQSELAKSEQAKASAMENLASAMTTMEAVVNTQKLEILPMMKEIYKTKNIQGIINEDYNENSKSI